MPHKSCQALKYATYDQMCFYRRLGEDGCRVLKPEKTEKLCGYGETQENAKRNLRDILHGTCSHIPINIAVGEVCQGETVGDETTTSISWWEWTKVKLSKIF